MLNIGNVAGVKSGTSIGEGVDRRGDRQERGRRRGSLGRRKLIFPIKVTNQPPLSRSYTGEDPLANANNESDQGPTPHS